MIGRKSGQDELVAWGFEHKPGILDRINKVRDWPRFEKTLRRVFKDWGWGRKSYPPVVILC